MFLQPCRPDTLLTIWVDFLGCIFKSSRIKERRKWSIRVLMNVSLVASSPDWNVGQMSEKLNEMIHRILRWRVNAEYIALILSLNHLFTLPAHKSLYYDLYNCFTAHRNVIYILSCFSFVENSYHLVWNTLKIKCLDFLLNSDHVKIT